MFKLNEQVEVIVANNELASGTIGTVHDIVPDNSANYPIVLKFDNKIMHITIDGKVSSNDHCVSFMPLSKKLDFAKKIYRLRNGCKYNHYKIHDIGNHPVHGEFFDKFKNEWIVIQHTLYGYKDPNHIVISEFDLVEVMFYDGFKQDEQVMYFDEKSKQWLPAHFAGISNKNLPLIYANGCTSWTTALTIEVESLTRIEILMANQS